MSIREDWDAISARIRGVASAAEHYRQSRMIQNHDSFEGELALRFQCAEILADLKEFRTGHAAHLDAKIVSSLDRFFTSSAAAHSNPSPGIQNEGTAMFITPFVTLNAEITFRLSDRQQHLRLRTERALLLLQRQLAVDEDVQRKWKRADNKEVACERLGGIHLLSQGIYGFKALATGAATDLILPELPDEREIMRASEGLVLTEWKWVSEADALAKYAEARAQAQIYSKGVLAGAELRAYRYLIGVSLAELPPACIPKDAVIYGVTYRHVNIVVEPEVPSKAARRSVRKAPKGALHQ